ncbi:MAG: hypothetical protein R6V49_05300 [Bacteroidales bacterium]
MNKLLTFIALILVTVTSYAQDGSKTGIIYGKNHAFFVTAPEGWVLDNQSGVADGLFAVFYEEGQTWQGAENVMYVTTASLEVKKHKTLKKLIAYDIKKFKKHSPKIKIEYHDTLITQDSASAIVVNFFGDSNGNYESVAYIDAGKTAVMIVMSSRSEASHRKSYAAFESLVRSYFFISENVNFENN